MSQLISFEDAVTAANLNPDQLYAIYYCDGDYANHTAVAERCPHAKLFAVTTRGATGHGIFACDSETGDLTIAETEAWVAEQVKLDVALICVYANRDRWLNLGLLDALAKYSHRIKRWDADFDGVAAVPQWADSEQYLSGGVDRNVALANFFGTTPPAPRPIDMWSVELQVSVPRGSTGHLNYTGRVDLEGGHWVAAGTPSDDAHFSGPGGGAWRSKGLPLNAKPLGGK